MKHIFFKTRLGCFLQCSLDASDYANTLTCMSCSAFMCVISILAVNTKLSLAKALQLVRDKKFNFDSLEPFKEYLGCGQHFILSHSRKSKIVSSTSILYASTLTVRMSHRTLRHVLRVSYTRHYIRHALIVSAS